MQRTGIHERRIAAPGEVTSRIWRRMAWRAPRSFIAKVDAHSIDLIVLPPPRPSINTFPASAGMVQAALGINHGAAFDGGRRCAPASVYALATLPIVCSNRAISSRALVIGAETSSRILDWTDRGTCVPYGDGAGAVVLDRQEQPDNGEEKRGIHRAAAPDWPS